MSTKVHRPGPFKQQNKTHKTGKHLSKGTLSSLRKGKVDAITLTNVRRMGMRKQDRRNQAKQLRANSRHKTVMEKRLVGIDGTPPHLIVVVPLTASVDIEVLYRLLCSACDLHAMPTPPTSTIISTALKQRFTICLPSSTNLYNLLDTAKIADTLLLVYGTNQHTDYYGDLCLSCLCSQGLATTFHVVQGFSDSYPEKKVNSCRKSIRKFVKERFPKEKVHQLETSQDAITLLRLLANQKKTRHVQCCEQRPHLLVEGMEHIPNVDKSGFGTLKVTGYLRGKPLSVNGLIQLPNYGSFQMAKIEAPVDPNSIKFKRPWNTMEEDDEVVFKVLEVANSTKQVSLVSEATPDPMEGEQTWPTEEELQEAADVNKQKKRVPKGTSEYQATWIEDDYKEGDAEMSSEYSDNDIDDDMAPHYSDDGSESHKDSETIDTDMDHMSIADDSQYDSHVDQTAEMQQLQLLKAAQEDRLFPDEVDTPLDIPARTRFARYRGLQSFKSSPWDPKENLPVDYARIFQFENFRHTQKKILLRAESDNNILVGWYISIYITNVPSSFTEEKLEAFTCLYGPLPTAQLLKERRRHGNTPLVVVGLLEHENKMSVLNFVLRRTEFHTLPIQSKERLIFHTGLRRFSAPTTFSQHTMGANKHKYERYFQPNVIASVFAPVEYQPSPVLVFKELSNGVHTLVATGSLLSVDPDRIICKKIVLSGHPLKIQKKSAIIRYMFFNREDILWFMPVELRTKYGRRGHIKEPLGTHGHMKCVFDGQLNAQDTILMSLYKRVFPKWAYQHEVATPTLWETIVDDEIAEDDKNDNDDDVEDDVEEMC